MDRRSLATLAAALAVLVTGCQADRTEPPAAGEVAASTAPTGPAAPTAAPTSNEGPVLDAADLPTGDPPRVAYAFSEHPTFGGGDWRLVRTDGNTQPFGHNPGSFTAYDDVVVNGYGTEGGLVVELWSGDGSSVRSLPPLCHFSVVATPDRNRLAWLEDDSLVTVASDGSIDSRPVVLPHGPCGDDLPVALSDALLYVDTAQGVPIAVTPRGWKITFPALRGLADVSARGNLVGQLAQSPRCWGLLRVGVDLRWRTCSDRLVSFAPDGRHVLGTEGSVADTSFRGVVVHGSHGGRVVARWATSGRQRVAQVEWEDAEHLLVVVRNPAVGWAVVRLGLDGSAEYAVAPVRTGADFAPFRLPMS
jgi:hypothetical protein